MGEIINPNEEEQEGINFKSILIIIRVYWLLFVVCIGLAILGAVIVNRYATPVYQIKSQLLLSNEEGGQGGLEILGSQSTMGYNPWDPTFINDKIQIIKSIRFLAPVMAQLDFEHEYFVKGNLKVTEVYQKVPFKISIEKKAIEVHQIKFDIEFKGNLVRITGEQESTILFDVELKPGEQLSHKYFNLQVNLNQDFVERGGSWRSLSGKKYLYRYKSANSVVRSYSRKINVSEIEKTKALELSVDEENIQKGIAFLNAVSNSFVRKGLDDKNQSFDTSIAFINEELKAVQITLGSIEDQKELFKKNKQVISFSDQTSGLIEQSSEIEAEKYQKELILNSVTALHDYLLTHDELSTIAPATFGITDPLLVPLISDLSKAYSDFKSASKTYKPDSDLYILASERVKSAKAQLLENTANIKKQSALILQQYNKRLEYFYGQLAAVPAIERNFVGIERQANVQEKIYLLLLEKKFEYEIAKSGNKSDYSILTEAYLAKQKSPVSNKNYSLALLLGLMVPSAYLFFKIFLDNKVRSREQIEQRTKVPFLAAIPHHKGDEQLVFLKSTKSITAESFRNLRTSIGYMILDDNEPKVILVTSTISGEGKTFCTLNIGHVINLSNKKVVILGLDLRKPKLHLDFDVKNDIGLSNYLVGKKELEEVIIPTGINNIDIIPSGPIPPNPSELILGERMDMLVTSLKKKYDYILFDIAPLGLVTDAMDLMRHVDLCVYIMREGYTKINAISYLNEFYNKSQIKNIGVVLNNSTFSGIKYGYGYGYGYGAGYGYGYGHGYGYGVGYGYGYYAEDKEATQSGYKKFINRVKSLFEPKK